MKLFSSVNDITDINALVAEGLELKTNPYAHQHLGKNKTLGLVFLNPSLRTRMSTQKAALNLGMNVMVLNVDKEGWALELRDNVVMNGTTVEHIREAAAVMGQYVDILGVRSFPGLKNREEDYTEVIFNKFVEFCGVPVMCKADVDFVITHPAGYELSTDFTQGATITHNQDEAIADADFIYVKNWSAYEPYGQIFGENLDWMLTNDRLKITNNAKVMHCLPVRRDLELSSEILDGPSSIVVHEAGNRVWAAQAVLKQMLEQLQ